jgi:hypothetical protein
VRSRLINLALVLIRDPLRGDQIDKQQLLGFAHHLRGDAARATGAIRDALAIVRDLKPPAGADAAQFAESTKQRLTILEAALHESSFLAAGSLPTRSINQLACGT